MSLLQTLRRANWMARLALLWFALTLGVAVASPMVNPLAELLICGSVGMVKVTLNADGALSAEHNNEAHCPLCVAGGAAPPAFASVQPMPVQALTYVLPGRVIVVMTASTAALPPSRGPPASIST